MIGERHETVEYVRRVKNECPVDHGDKTVPNF